MCIPLYISASYRVSNHTDKTKRAVIKGYTERARSYCDPAYLNKELENIVNVFQDNGYSKAEIKKAMKNRPNTEGETREEPGRVIVVMPHIHGFSQRYNKIARKHGFKVANKTEKRVKDLIGNAKTPLGNKISGLVYNIPCHFETNAYTGETDRMWESRDRGTQK